MKFIDALGNIKFGKSVFFGNNIQMSEQQDGVVTINAGILSGTGSRLALLGDVNIVNPTNNQVLTYQSSTATWVNSGTVGGGSTTLAGLSDVTITSASDDQFLRFNAGTSKWINQLITAADVGAGTFKAGNFTYQGSILLPAGSASAPTVADVATGKTGLVFGFTTTGDLALIVSGAPHVVIPPQFNQRMSFLSSMNIFHGSGMAASTTVSQNAYSSAGGSGWQAFIDSGAAVTGGSRLGFYTFGGATDAAHTTANAASIEAFATAGWSAGNNPAYISFLTTAIGSGTRTEQVRITDIATTIFDNEVVGLNLLVSGTTTLNGFISSGTNTLIGVNTKQVGQSNFNTGWPNVLVNYDNLNHFTSGTAETSVYSTTLFANSVAKTGQTLKIKGIWRCQPGQGGNWMIKLGSTVLASGCLGPNQMSPFEVTTWRIDAGSFRTTWMYYSGTSLSAIGSLPATATPQIFFTGSSQLITWAVDNLIDFRANTYILSSNFISLEFFQISTEST